ncbi:MAG: FadR/GntR family transcriptional regulator [Pseudomonadota bacterium]
MSEKRLYHTIARAILDMIESGAYPPGTRLPGERELAEKFGVSRVVVREAEISLEAIGRLSIRVGSGVYVQDVAESSGLILPSVTPFELTQTRLLFESECAALAATQITDAQLDGLRETIERMAEAPHDAPDGEDADREFHLQIAQATGNAANVFFLQNLWRMRTEIDSVRKVYAAVCFDDTSHRVNEHSEILDALAAHDPQAAREAMQGHFKRLLEALLDASERQAIEEARQRSSANRERYLRMASAR